MESAAPSGNGNKTALVVGSTGIVGRNLANHLLARGWKVYGLARDPAADSEIKPVGADLRDATAVKGAAGSLKITHVFLSTWLRHNTEAENVRVNGAMIENVLTALASDGRLQHAALVTGTKQYLGPFDAYGKAAAETPFREDTPRLPGENFYYTQEDQLFAAAKEKGFSWSVHRPHTESRLLFMPLSAARPESGSCFLARSCSGTPSRISPTLDS